MTDNLSQNLHTSSKILVTGASGFIGSAVTNRLLSEGYFVRGVRRNNSLRTKHSNLEDVCYDLTDPKQCKIATEGITAIIHAAAYTTGAAEIATTPLAHITPNVVMTSQLMEAAHKAGCNKFLYISSGVVYPVASYPNHKFSENLGHEGSPLDIYHASGWMKRYIEKLCETYGRHIPNPMETVVVRPSNIYGPGDKFDPLRSHVTAATIRKIAERHAPLIVWGDGNDKRDLIYIEDFIDGLMKAFHHGGHGYTVNICSGHTISIKDLIALLIEIDQFHEAHLTFDNSKPQTAKTIEFNMRKALDELDFKITTDLRTGLCNTLNWYKAHCQN